MKDLSQLQKPSFVNVDYDGCADVELPNLDCFVRPDDAGEAAKDLHAVSEVFRHLASYAEGKQMGMICRIKGEIGKAKCFEDACDNVYRLLPEWAKW